MVTPTAISIYLGDLRLPATRDEIVDFAQNKSAPNYVLAALTTLPDEVYESLAEVWAILGNLGGSGV